MLSSSVHNDSFFSFDQTLVYAPWADITKEQKIIIDVGTNRFTELTQFLPFIRK